MNDAHKQQQLWFEHLWPWVHRRDNTVIIDRIDHTLDGLCPCGATPRPDSPYCSYDCEPTHIARNTDTRTTGALATPMRWRPDLVSAAPDDGLTSVAARTRVGRFWREVFERDGFDGLHLRLDDGHRFVGADVSAEFGDDAHCEVWERLERELTNPRHTARPDCRDSGATIEAVMPGLLARCGVEPGQHVRPEHPETLWARTCTSCGRRAEPAAYAGRDFCPWCWTRHPGPHLESRVRKSVAPSDLMRHRATLSLSANDRLREVNIFGADLLQADDVGALIRRTWARLETELLADLDRAGTLTVVNPADAVVRRVSDGTVVEPDPDGNYPVEADDEYTISWAMARYASQIQAIQAAVGAETTPTDPRERALAHVRNRNTGPQVNQRVPRRIDPRRRR